MLATGLLVTLLAAAGGAGPPAAGALPGEERRARIREQLDWERSAAELPPLVRSAALDAAAQRRAETLAALRTPPPLVDELAAAGYEAAAAELVKMSGGGTPERKVSTLLERSGAFRRLVLGEELTEVGIGVASQAGRPLDLVIFARSRADLFAEETVGLADAETVRAELLEWANWARDQYGDARPLERDGCLERVAQAYAERMLAEGFFGHLSPEGRNALHRVRSSGCAALRVGENLASGPLDAVDVVASWLESPRHRQVLLDRGYRTVGFGLAFGRGPDGRRVIWVLVVGDG
ncbi:MAG: CAP domain-containing protein [Thermoanaerobaculia bacterium]|nr:CAP domain-containing protein [Thermoanaerobaculia bacterium]